MEEKKCFYVLYGNNFDIQETWHISNEDPLRILKMAYMFAKKQELIYGKKSKILYSDKQTKVDKQTIKLALNKYKEPIKQVTVMK